MDKETTRRLGWVYGEWRPGLRDSERELSGEGCEQCLNCWGGGDLRGCSPKVEGLPQCF